MHREALRGKPWPAALIVLTLTAATSLGAQQLASDLIYTTIQPCRIVDTRQPGAGGSLMPGVNRTFNVVGVGSPGSLMSQGGNPNGCPIPGFVAAGFPRVLAIAVNLVAVGPSGAGDILAWPSDQTQPAASVLNYASVTGLNIANAVILPVRQDTQGNDITVKAQISGTHLVGDVLGYFVSFSKRGDNTGVGLVALDSISTGQFNTAVGSFALPSATTQSYNTALGDLALFALNSAAERNVAVGTGALMDLSSGDRNVAIGQFAGFNNSSGSDNIYVGNMAPGAEGGTIRIGIQGTQGATFIAGINGATSASGVPVFVNSDGQLGTATSSLRFKDDVEAMGEASDGLMNLRPVTFRYKPGYDDGSRLLQYGLLAEEVAAVYPGLVQFDRDGRPAAVRYQFLNTMLLNEVQKQHARIEDLEGQLAAQRSKIEEAAREADQEQRRAAEQEKRLERLEAAGPR